jgi:ABC-type uncharacterized transport system substrate-binding protein
MDREQPDSILMVADALTILNRTRVFDYATAHRLPAIYEYDFFVRDGGLMSYGPDFKESFQRAASLVDRIFKGAKPANADYGHRSAEILRHGVLLVLWRPLPASIAGGAGARPDHSIS